MVGKSKSNDSNMLKVYGGKCESQRLRKINER